MSQRFYSVQEDKEGFPVLYIHPDTGRLMTYTGPFLDAQEAEQAFQLRFGGPKCCHPMDENQFQAYYLAIRRIATKQAEGMIEHAASNWQGHVRTDQR